MRSGSINQAAVFPSHVKKTVGQRQVTRFKRAFHLGGQIVELV